MGLSYRGQVRDLRKFAIAKYGADKTATMTDDDIYDKIIVEDGYTTLQTIDDDEEILLIRVDILEELEKAGEAVWLFR